MKVIFAALIFGTVFSIDSGHLMLHGISIADSLLDILLAFGAFVAWYQWRKSRMVSRTIFFNDLIKGFKDDQLQNVFYKYIGSPDKKSKFYHGGFNFEPGAEMDIDRLLTYYNKICYMRNNGAISKEDYRLFEYQIHKVLKSEQIQSYLSDMAFKSKTVTGDNYPFVQLIEEGNAIGGVVCSCYVKIFTKLMGTER